MKTNLLLMGLIGLVLAIVVRGFWVSMGESVPKERIQLDGHTEAVMPVAFSPDGETLASGSFDNTIKLWDVADGNNIATLQGHPLLIGTLNRETNFVRPTS